MGLTRPFLLICVWALLLCNSSVVAKEDKNKNKNKNKNKEKNKNKNNKDDTEPPTPAPSLRPTPFPTVAPKSPAPTSPAPTSPAPTSPAPTPVVTSSPSSTGPTTLSPTFTPSLGPSESGSTIPTTWPSISPSYAPSASPTIAPSTVPSDVPSSHAPSILPTNVPSSSPSDVPSTGAPSVKESASPSDSTQPSRAPSVTITKVNMPKIEVAFLVVGGPFPKEDFEPKMESFLRDYLTSNQNILGNLSHADITVTVADRRRLQESVLIASVEGVANFEGSSFPSEDRLEEVLRSYFSAWGVVDLEDSLGTADTRVETLQFALNGEMLVTNQPITANTSRSTTDDDSSMSTGLIVGVVLAAIAFTCAVGLVIWQRRRFRKQNNETATPLTMKSGRSEADLDDHVPRELFSNADEFSFPGALSLDGESIFTTNSPLTTDDYAYSNPAEFSRQHDKGYDAKRLDKVISIAHEDVGLEGGADSDSDNDFNKDYMT